MTDNEGDPICIEVFQGNTLDYKTVESQLNKIKNEYGVEKIVFVGDRGMIKSTQINSIKENDNWYYITAITKSQIEKMLKDDIIQYSLFDSELCEIKYENTRYILKKNPIRTEEIKSNLNDKIERLKNIIDKKNKYLKEHKKASLESAKKFISKYCETRKLNKIINIQTSGKTFSFTKNEDEIKEHLKLAGCYVIKSNVSEKELSKEQIHSGYKNLAKVEHGFQKLKTALINLRPLFVRLETHIRGHVFACMLALKVALYMEKELKPLDFTFQYCLKALNSIQTINYTFQNKKICCLPDKFSDDNEKILKQLTLNWEKVL